LRHRCGDRLRRGAFVNELIDAIDQRLALKGLLYKVVRAGSAGAILVKRLERSGKQEDRDLGESGIGLDRLAYLVAGFSRQRGIRKDDVRHQIARHGEGVFPIVDRRHL
jgi:hypothetical protein